jgi:hypothetical protein
MAVSASTARPSAEFDWQRFVPAIAVFAGLVWACFGFESIVRPHEHAYGNILFYIPWLPSMVVVYAVHALHRELNSRFERWAGRALLASMGLVVIGQPGIIFDSTPLMGVALAGFIGFVLSTLAFGIAVARAGIVPKPLGWALAFTQLGTMAMGLALSPWVPLADDGSYSGAVVHGAVFLSLAIWMVRNWDTVREQPQQRRRA